MIVDLILFTAGLIGCGIAAIGFVFNASTPMQVGPIPVIGGAALAFICVVALIARIAIGR